MGPENDKLVFALPRGRILAGVMPLLGRPGVEPETAFEDAESRKLRFATFLAFGAAQLGIACNDVLMEFDSPDIYGPLDLGVGRCRLSVAEPAEMTPGDDPARWSRPRIATKYPRTARRHFAGRGVQAECIKLSGAMELAPSLSVCRRIVYLISTGETLRANGLVEVELIAHVTSRLAVNRAAWKTRSTAIRAWIDRYEEAVDAMAA